MTTIWREARYLFFTTLPIPGWPRCLERWWLAAMMKLRFEYERASEGA